MSFIGFRPTLYPGGSNLITATAPGNVGAIKQYHKFGVTAQVQAFLTDAYNAGHRVLRLPICCFEGAGSAESGDPVNLDCAFGQLMTQDGTNLAAILAYAKRLGFVEFILAFMPSWTLAEWITQGTKWDEQKWQAFWNFLCKLMAVMEAAGVYYRLDVLNEPASNGVVLKAFCQRTWGAVLITFFARHTPRLLGAHFSINTDWLHLLDDIYRPFPVSGDKADIVLSTNDPVWPNLWDVHLYKDATNRATATLAKLTSLGQHRTPWISGEMLKNDPQERDELLAFRAAHPELTWLYACQWGVSRTDPDNTGQSSMPVERDIYNAVGI